jgi:hypothetical protein
MKTVNELPRLIECLKRWKTRPPRAEFDREYGEPLKPWLAPMLEDFSFRFDAGLYDALEDLDWKSYREETLALDPSREEKRLIAHMAAVEKLFGTRLEGEVVLFGAFTLMDGYARFDRGTHRVFLGVDESHGRGCYLDVLLTHELTHVIRESRPETWAGWGLDLRMTHDQFTESQPVIEHLFSEGLSCAVSEILNPGEDPWGYAYQTEDSLAHVFEHGPGVDRVIREELRRGEQGDYGTLYNVSHYPRGSPGYTHYVWAWQWVKSLTLEWGKGDPREGARRLVTVCSKDLLESALAYRLTRR